jgi:sugar lactone lactonase YvrE
MAARHKVLTTLVAALGLANMAGAATPPAEIHIPGDRVVPESLTSSKDGTIYIGSILARTVYRVKPGADTAEAWIKPESGAPLGIFGVFADDASRTLWVCYASGSTPPEGPPPPQSELYAFDLRAGSLKGHYPLPTPSAFCNDIAVDSKGNIYATDTLNMQVVRLKHGASQLEVWTPDGAFGPKGSVVDGISVVKDTLYVNTLATSKVFSVPIGSDGKAGTVSEVELDRTVDRPDGMRAFGKDGVLIVEGGGAGRLSRIKFSGNSGKVTGLKEGYPDRAVAVTVVGETAYVLEAQFKMIKPPPDYKPNPFHATAVHVGKPN